MKQLGEKNPLSSIRFWGKILGTNADYYVCETMYKEGTEPTPEEDQPKGKQKDPSKRF